MQTKLDTLKNAAAAQDWQGALRIAAKFADLGEHKAAIVRGHEAHSNARFASQLGRDPAADIEAGIQALCARYSLNRDGSASTAPKREVTAAYLTAAAPAAEPAPKAPRAPKPEIEAKRRAMLAAADAKGFGPRWAEALAAAGRGELANTLKPTSASSLLRDLHGLETRRAGAGQASQRPKFRRLIPKIPAQAEAGWSYWRIGRELGLNKSRVTEIVKRHCRPEAGVRP